MNAPLRKTLDIKKEKEKENKKEKKERGKPERKTTRHVNLMHEERSKK